MYIFEAFFWAFLKIYENHSFWEDSERNYDKKSSNLSKNIFKDGQEFRSDKLSDLKKEKIKNDYLFTTHKFLKLEEN